MRSKKKFNQNIQVVEDRETVVKKSSRQKKVKSESDDIRNEMREDLVTVRKINDSEMAADSEPLNADEESLDKAYTQAVNLYNSKMYEAARDAFEEVRAVNPNFRSTKAYLARSEKEINRQSRLSPQAKQNEIEAAVLKEQKRRRFMAEDQTADLSSNDKMMAEAKAREEFAREAKIREYQDIQKNMQKERKALEQSEKNRRDAEQKVKDNLKKKLLKEENDRKKEEARKKKEEQDARLETLKLEAAQNQKVQPAQEQSEVVQEQPAAAVQSPEAPQIVKDEDLDQNLSKQERERLKRLKKLEKMRAETDKELAALKSESAPVVTSQTVETKKVALADGISWNGKPEPTTNVSASNKEEVSSEVVHTVYPVKDESDAYKRSQAKKQLNFIRSKENKLVTEQKRIIEKQTRQIKIQLAKKGYTENRRLNDEIDGMYNYAVKLYKTGQYNDAQLQFLNIARMRPNYKSTEMYLSKIAAISGHQQDSERKDIEKKNKLEEEAKAVREKAEALKEKAEKEKAEAAKEKAEKERAEKEKAEKQAAEAAMKKEKKVKKVKTDEVKAVEDIKEETPANTEEIQEPKVAKKTKAAKKKSKAQDIPVFQGMSVSEAPAESQKENPFVLSKEDKLLRKKAEQEKAKAEKEKQKLALQTGRERDAAIKAERETARLREREALKNKLAKENEQLKNNIFKNTLAQERELKELEIQRLKEERLLLKEKEASAERNKNLAIKQAKALKDQSVRQKQTEVERMKVESVKQDKVKQKEDVVNQKQEKVKQKENIIKQKEEQQRQAQEIARMRTEIDKTYQDALQLSKMKRFELSREKLKKLDQLLTVSNVPENYREKMRQKTDMARGQVEIQLAKEREKNEKLAKKSEEQAVREEILGEEKVAQPEKIEKPAAASKKVKEVIREAPKSAQETSDIEQLRKKIEMEDQQLAKDKEAEALRLKKLEEKKRKEEINEKIQNVKKVPEVKKEEPVIVTSEADELKKAEDDKRKELDRLVKYRQQELRTERERLIQELNESVEHLYDKAVRLYESGYQDEAKNLLTEVQDLKPGYKKTTILLNKIDEDAKKSTVVPAAPKVKAPVSKNFKKAKKAQSREDMISQALDSLETQTK